MWVTLPLFMCLAMVRKLRRVKGRGRRAAGGASSHAWRRGAQLPVPTRHVLRHVGRVHPARPHLPSGCCFTVSTSVPSRVNLSTCSGWRAGGGASECRHVRSARRCGGCHHAHAPLYNGAVLRFCSGGEPSRPPAPSTHLVVIGVLLERLVHRQPRPLGQLVSGQTVAGVPAVVGLVGLRSGEERPVQGGTGELPGLQEGGQARRRRLRRGGGEASGQEGRRRMDALPWGLPDAAWAPGPPRLPSRRRAARWAPQRPQWQRRHRHTCLPTSAPPLTPLARLQVGVVVGHGAPHAAQVLVAVHHLVGPAPVAAHLGGQNAADAAAHDHHLRLHALVGGGIAADSHAGLGHGRPRNEWAERGLGRLKRRQWALQSEGPGVGSREEEGRPVKGPGHGSGRSTRCGLCHSRLGVRCSCRGA